MAMSNGADDLIVQLDRVARAFSPSSPITTKDLFSGRTTQLNRLIDVAAQRGQHALVYGDRGVGKTSLAKVVLEGSENAGRICAYYTCASTDTFSSIWHRTLEEVRWVVESQPPGYRSEAIKTVQSARQLLPADPSPDDVRRVLSLLAKVDDVVIFVDEFDRPTDAATRSMFADTIKVLSDHGVAGTIVLVGVASAVAELVAEHESIGRSLIQIQMPLMSNDELAQIVRAGMVKAELEVAPQFVDQVVAISQGLPHYTHLIAQHGARYAVESGRRVVEVEDLKPAVSLALEDVSQTVRQTYHRATSSNRETIYKEVLLACALAERDELGEFGSADIRRPLRQLTGRDYDIPAYSAHLNDFASTGQRGGVLKKLGTQARFRYRFIDPLMPSYVLMRGHSSDML